MSFVLTNVLMKLSRYRMNRPWRRNRVTARGQQSRGSGIHASAKQLHQNLAGQHFGKQRRDRVSQLTLHGTQRTADRDIIGKGLETTELAAAQATILSMKGTDRGAGLGLDGPGGSALRELQQKRPISTSPTEERQAAAPFGVPQIVLHPAKEPLRILLATDAAREGLNFQAHCTDLFHFDLPWNPGRIEQRNGRIDRKLQPAPTVRCHHFVLPQQ